MLTLFPLEIIGKIACFLDDWDLISLAAIDEEIAEYLASAKRKLMLSPAHGSDCKLPISLLSFVTACSKYDKLCHLDLSHCYWLEVDVTVDLLRLLSSTIKSLAIQGTKLNAQQIAFTLKHCKALSHLSISLSKKDSWLWLSACDSEELRDEVYSPRMSVFSECCDQLKQISHLRLYSDDVELPALVLCFCDALKSLHLDFNTGANLSLKESLTTGRRLRVYKSYFLSFHNLTSITGRINTLFETANLFPEFAGLVLSALASQLEVLWLPNVPSNQYERCVKVSLEGLQTFTLPESMNQYDQLKYIRTPNPGFMSKFPFKFELLTDVSCCFDPEHFVGFACTHRDLKVLQLMPLDFPSGSGQGSSDSLVSGLTYLQQLEKLSIGFGVAKNETFSLPTAAVQRLYELEYGLFLQNILLLRARRFLEVSRLPRADDLLTSLRGFISLRRITIANIAIKSYSLVSQILSSCNFLQSLRLSNVTCDLPPHEWIASLKDGLGQAKHLKDFRYSVEDGTDFGGSIRLTAMDGRAPLPIDSLTKALHSCQSLRRFAIISRTNASFTSAIELEWSSLVLACFVLPQLVCDTLIMNLTSSSPAFVRFVGSSVAEAALQLPQHHFNDLVLLDSKVCKMPSNFEETLPDLPTS